MEATADDPLHRLLDGFETFRHVHVNDEAGQFRRLAQEGQAPKVLVIGCSDSRVDPAILTRCKPGDLFIVRNVAALVPPRENDGRHHGTSSAIEFAVKGLNVEHIVVLGHSSCGGVRALADPAALHGAGYEFLEDWVGIAGEARDAVDAAGPAGGRETLGQACVLLSLRNLLSYPWIKERFDAGRATLHGWYFDLKAGELSAYDPHAARFHALRGQTEGYGPEIRPCVNGCQCGTTFDVAEFARRAAGDAAF